MAILFDASSNTSDSSATSLTWDHTCTGADRLLIVGINLHETTDLDRVVSGITYNGVALTQAKTQVDDSNNITADLWYLINPASGQNSVVASFVGINLFAVGGAISLTGADQISQPDATNGATGSGNPVTVDITTLNDNCWVVDSIFAFAQSNTPAEGDGQVARWVVPISTSHGFGSSEGPKTPAGLVTMSWSNIQAARDWVTAVASFRPAVATEIAPIISTSPAIEKQVKITSY